MSHTVWEVLTCSSVYGYVKTNDAMGHALVIEAVGQNRVGETFPFCIHSWEISTFLYQQASPMVHLAAFMASGTSWIRCVRLHGSSSVISVAVGAV